MPRSQILATLVSLARVTFDEESLAFDEATSFSDIEDWDSFNHIHMVVGMEKAFSIRFDVGDLQQLKRVADLIDVIERRQGT